MRDNLKKRKRNGMNIMDLGCEEIISNAYRDYAYFTRNVSIDLQKKCEDLLGFPVYKDYESLVESIHGL